MRFNALSGQDQMKEPVLHTTSLKQLDINFKPRHVTFITKKKELIKKKRSS